MFLDEIGEIEERIQAKLLRVLQSGELRRVGGTEAIYVKTRIVAATNKRLEDEVAQGRFREDLLFRLNVVTLEVPPLRSRVDDIDVLFAHFLGIYGGGKPRRVTPPALEVLRRYSWPGNVRELENTVRRLLIFHDQEVIDEGIIQSVLPRGVERENESLLTLADLERRHVLRVKTLYNKLHQYGEMGRSPEAQGP
jgi:DNA-binding NtrC family response regulator